MKEHFALVGMSGLLVATSLFVGGNAFVNGAKDSIQPKQLEVSENVPSETLSSEVVTEVVADSDTVKPPISTASHSTSKESTEANNAVRSSIESRGSESAQEKDDSHEFPKQENDDQNDENHQGENDHAQDGDHDKDREHEEGDHEEGDHEEGDHEEGDHEEGDHEEGDHEEREPGSIEEFELSGDDLAAWSPDATPLTTEEMLTAPLARLAKIINSSDGPSPAELHGTWEVIPCHRDNSVIGTRSFDSLNLKVNSGAYYETVQYYIDKEEKVLGPQTSTTLYVKVDEDQMLAVVNHGTPNAKFSVLKKISSEVADKDDATKENGSKHGENSDQTEESDSDHAGSKGSDEKDGDKAEKPKKRSALDIWRDKRTAP